MKIKFMQAAATGDECRPGVARLPQPGAGLGAIKAGLLATKSCLNAQGGIKLHGEVAGNIA